VLQRGDLAEKKRDLAFKTGNKGGRESPVMGEPVEGVRKEKKMPQEEGEGFTARL